jgi:membrane associated rhomboid family serine protease
MNRRRLLTAGAAGALWGLAGYALLWGYTPFVVHRTFVVSVVGTVVLLPVRIVLWGIRFVEENLAGEPFDFSANNGWIGVLAAAVGAGAAVVAFLLIRAVAGAMRRRRPRATPVR